MIKYVPREFKTILNKYKFIDSWFWCRYSINPYNGCEFACTYCDSRSHKYHLQPEFDQLIYVKSDVGTMLDNRLRRARTLFSDVVAIGGTCDAYQPAEAEHKNTRQCLEILLKYHYPVIISTKSTLILRDLDILSRIAKDSWCAIGVTITTLDRKLASFLEPKAPSPEKRLNVVKEIKEICPEIQAGVNLIPIIPFLTDDDENMEDVVSGAKAAGADFILFGGGMTMRDNQAAWFLKRLSQEFPHLIEKYEELYQGRYTLEEGYQGRYNPEKSYCRRINRKMLELCERYKLAFRLKRYIPDDFRRQNYLVAQKLLDESYMSQMLGKPWTKTFWAGQNINNLGESIEDIARRNGLRNIRNIDPSIEEYVLDLLRVAREGR
ncbi:MAG: radical SAM protein [Chloroflexota bacterium]|nr:radical SAM protein [Chloroflexota bacterium]